MCGFLGSFNNQIDDVNIWLKVAKTIDYRGNNWGFYKNEKIQLLSNRLARNGNDFRSQPVVTNLKSILVFNGEIYDKALLANRLGVKNEKDIVDIELLALYFDKYGLENLDVLDGEFSFCFYCGKSGKVFLARDFFGTKPLFWLKNNNKFYFGSSAKGVSILDNGSIDQTKVLDFLKYSITSSGNSYLNVNTLRPGNILIIDKEKIEIKPINLKFPIKSLDNLLKTSINKRINDISSTSLAYSAGLDSSLIKFYADDKLKKYCFKLNIDRRINHDENIYDVNCSFNKLESHFEKISLYSERPITSSLSSIAMMELYSQMSEKGKTVALSGEGADELFLGYPTYFLKSKGHPGLKTRLPYISFIQNIFEFTFEKFDTKVEEYLKTDNPNDWLFFDRMIRLPEHLMRMNSDIPSLVYGIESRTPFLDLYGNRETNVILANLREPKEKLWNIVNEKQLNISKNKVGLYYGFENLSDLWILEAIKFIVDNIKCFDFLPTNAINGLRKIEILYHEIRKLPIKQSVFCINSINSFVFGLWSFLISNYKYSSYNNNNNNELLELFLKGNKYTAVTKKDEYIKISSI